MNETSIDVQGKLHWIWAFTAPSNAYSDAGHIYFENRRTSPRRLRKVKKLIGKISNGFEYWFTFIIHLGVEPTNNRAERALRTWGQQGLDSLQMLRACLGS